MNTGTKTVIAIVFLAAFGATTLSYYKYVVKKDIRFETEGFFIEE